jgi:hypothetical protein
MSETATLDLPVPESASPAPAAPPTAESTPTEPVQMPYAVGEDGSIQMMTKVNGQDQELVLNPNDVADRLRKGETFHQNQAQLKAREAELNRQAEALKGVDPSMLAQVRELQKLKDSDPAKFNELQYSMNKQIIEPTAPAAPTQVIDDEAGKLIENLHKLSQENPDLKVVGDIGTLFQTFANKMSSENAVLREELNKVTGVTGEVKQTLEQTQQQRAQLEESRKLNEVKTFLETSGLNTEQILAKAEAFNTLFYKGVDPRKAAEIIYEYELKTQTAPSAPPETPFTPMTPGSAIGGGAGATSPEAQKEKDIFGRQMTNISP